jgi:hypothetical protein
MASTPIATAARKALDRRAIHRFGEGTSGSEYVRYWVREGRSIAGLARTIGTDIRRPALSRWVIEHIAHREYRISGAERAELRREANRTRLEREVKTGAEEAPPMPPAPSWMRAPKPAPQLRAREWKEQPAVVVAA